MLAYVRVPVRRGNILHFLAWALFYRFPAQLSSEEVRELDEHIDRLQRAARHVFPLGFNADVRCIRLSLDPLKAMHRPLFLYGLVAVANSAARVVLQWRGFQRKQVGGFRYWHWAPGAQAEPKFPLVFMHGLGHGLVHYLHFLKPLRDHPLFLVELPHVSTRVWERVPTPEETVGAVHIMLTEHNFTRAVFIGHSYGTINVAWALKLRPAMVQSALLIDPVSLLLCLPKVAYSFVYRRPDTLLTWISFLFFSRELGISRTMSRAFWWQTNALSLSDIPCFPRTDRLGARGPPCERPDCCLRAPAEAAAPGSVMAATVHAARDLSTLPFFAWDRPSTAPRPAATPRAARALPDEVTLPTAPEPPAAGCARLKVAVVLSGEDTLVPSAHILRHLQLFRAELGASLRVLHFPTHGHARFLVDRRASEQIIALVPWLDAV